MPTINRLRYPIYNLNDKEFEDLVVLICEKILGTGTINFSEGKDGGRDAKFTGTANKFPSDKEPWKGKFIIQAKHTTKPTASCSDSEFHTILKKEIPKINELKKLSCVDYYLLFTNRRLPGIGDKKIEDFLSENVGIENCVIGIERIELWLESHPEIVRALQLNKLLLPLQFYEEDIRNVIIAFSKLPHDQQLREIQEDNSYIRLNEKNERNKLSKEYFDDLFKKSVNNFKKIEAFLKNPQNEDYKRKYDNTVGDIQEKIIIKREEYDKFDDLLSYLYDWIFDLSNDDLLKNRNLIRVFLHYMYYHCDIGLKEG